MKTILIIEDDPKAPNGVTVSTMRILTEPELQAEKGKQPTKASAMMAVIEGVLSELSIDMEKMAKMPKNEGEPCLH